MNISINLNYEIQAVEIFEAERNSVTHNQQNKLYSEAEIHKIEKMAAYIKHYVCLQPSNFKDCGSVKEDAEGFRIDIKQYDTLVRMYKEQNFFHEPYFFVTPTAAYQYQEIVHTDWVISPVHELDHYSLFFAFKLRNIPAQEIRSFLEYQQKIFDGDFLFFLKTLLSEHQEVLSSNVHAIVTIWLDMQEAMAKSQSAKAEPPIRPIKWKGTQKQLGELFIELKEKGWIEKFEYATIKKCFTKSNTIQQVLKPGQDKHSKEATYDQIYTQEYCPYFSKI